MANEILKRDQNHITVLGGVTDDSNQYVTMLRVDPSTKRLLVSATGGSGSVTVYNSTITGTINGSNTVFTSANTIAANGAISLFLAGMPYQAGVDYTYSGTTITFTTAPDASLTGQPFWIAHV